MRRNGLKVLGALFAIMLLVLLGLMGYVDYNQKAILQNIIAQLNKNIKGKLTMEKVSLTIFSEFPNLSVSLDNGVILDSAEGRQIFNAGKIYCRLNPYKLLFRQIDVRSVVIQNGNIFLRQDSLGLNAANIFIASKDTAAGPLNISFNVKELKLLGLHLSFNDELRNKHISLTAQNMLGNISKKDSFYYMQLKGNIHTDSMLFKVQKGSFLYSRDVWANLNLAYNKFTRHLQIAPSPVVVDSQRYALQGDFCFAKKPATLSLQVTGHAVNFDKGKLVLSSVILSRLKNISVPDPVDVGVLIQGPILPDTPPQVDARFTITNGRIQYFGASLTEVNMHGFFMNHVDTSIINVDPNSELMFDFTKAKINGVPCQAKLSVTDLVALHTEITAAINTPLTALNQTIGADTIKYRFISGNGTANIHYKGTIYYYMDTIKSNFDDTLTGSICVTDGAFDYSQRDIALTDMQTDIAFTQNQVDLKHISCAINGNAVKMNGTVNSIRRIVSGEVEKMVGNLNVEAPRFDLTKILVLKKLMAPVAATAPLTATQADKISALIDTVTSMLSINLSVKCNEFIFRKLKADNVSGNINASSNGLQVSNFNLNTCNGSLTINGSLNTAQNYDRLTGTAAIRNIDIKQFLTSLENFDQTTIKDDNITGTLNAQLSFASPLKANYSIITDSMQGKAHFSLKNGSLVNFEPLENVGKNIFKNRDFKHVAFAEIKDTVDLHDNTFYLHKMEIASSVLRLFIQGRFSFTGACDLAIQVPLNNLRKKDINYEPENIGLDAKAGPSIFLRVLSDKNNKVKITLDPTARQRMKKEITIKPITKAN